jgi:hypothetical protein
MLALCWTCGGGLQCCKQVFWNSDKEKEEISREPTPAQQLEEIERQMAAMHEKNAARAKRDKAAREKPQGQRPSRRPSMVKQITRTHGKPEGKSVKFADGTETTEL